MNWKTLCASLVVSGLALSGCGAVYYSPRVSEGAGLSGTKVRVVPLTAESVLAANRSGYTPKTLPSVFYSSAGTGGAPRGTGATPDPVFLPESRPPQMETRVPPNPPQAAYRIGIEDELRLATPKTGSTVEELSGLLAAETRRQGYRVQDDGAISIPDVGRIMVAGKSLEEAETEIFNRLVEAGMNPAFSLEISEFGSQRVAVGGAVNNPTVVPITLSPLLLQEALNAAGGANVPDRDYALIRIYRQGKLYQVPLVELYQRRDLQGIRLQDGDSIFLDTEFDLTKAQGYFAEQIELQKLRRDTRSTALADLQSEVDLRRDELEERRENFEDRLDFGAVDRDYVYIVGEVNNQARYPLPFGQTATLADALYDDSDGIFQRTGDPRHIYVLRASAEDTELGGVTAWNLDIRNAGNLMLATRLELRPNDVVFVAEQPVTRWNRVVSQIGFSVVNSSVSAVAN